jgi:hypothetical protein
VRATAVAESEMAGGKFQRITGKHIAGIRAGIARPE